MKMARAANYVNLKHERLVDFKVGLVTDKAGFVLDDPSEGRINFNQNRGKIVGNACIILRTFIFIVYMQYKKK